MVCFFLFYEKALHAESFPGTPISIRLKFIFLNFSHCNGKMLKASNPEVNSPIWLKSEHI